jgi:hypothetical protein
MDIVRVAGRAVLLLLGVTGVELGHVFDQLERSVFEVVRM